MQDPSCDRLEQGEREGESESERDKERERERKKEEKIAKPSQFDLENVGCLARPRKENPRAAVQCKYQNSYNIMEVWTDTDHAGCSEARNSANGRVIMFGTHVIKH